MMMLYFSNRPFIPNSRIPLNLHSFNGFSLREIPSNSLVNFLGGLLTLKAANKDDQKKIPGLREAKADNEAFLNVAGNNQKYC